VTPGDRIVGLPGAGISVRAHAPGRVNLIGDHTDYTGGLVLPMAIDLGTTVELRRHGAVVELVSADRPDPAVVTLDITVAGAGALNTWARFPAGVVAVLRPAVGGLGTVRTTLPMGAGLSSSSALTVAVALALGATGTVADVARLCQRAEQLGSGVPGGIMDQLCSLAGQAGRALLIDCSDLAVTPVAVPEEWEVIVAHCGQERELVDSAYAERRRDCDRAAELLGPLAAATESDAAGLDDESLRRRARHVITENGRVRAAVAAIRSGDGPGLGTVMAESHRSLSLDFDVSTPALDALVAALSAVPGVFGARLTGAGFGGCAVAVAAAGAWARAGGDFPWQAWVVRPSAGAAVEVTG
jgi:galactokinase